MLILLRVIIGKRFIKDIRLVLTNIIASRESVYNVWLVITVDITTNKFIANS